METVLALAALSFGDERHDVADLMLAGLLTGKRVVGINKIGSMISPGDIVQAIAGAKV